MSFQMEKKVLLAEDHAIVVKGLRMIFETGFKDYKLHTTRNSKELMRLLKNNSYALVIIDLQLEDGDMNHLIGDIFRIYPHLNILIFSANPEEVYAGGLFRAGAKGYLNKSADDEEIIKAIRLLLHGKLYMSENFKISLITKMRVNNKRDSIESLTTRQMEVAHLLKQGIKPSEIGRQLNLQPSTVATFKMKIFSKLKVSNIIELKDVFENFHQPNLT